MGGAMIPVSVGRLGDHFGLRAGFTFLYLIFGCVLSVGFWARPIITNATVRLENADALQPVS
jgi:FHS family L-fucose permease-like MFS transporter